MKNILFVANNSVNIQGLSGGDRIYIELMRHWQDKINIKILGPIETANFIAKHKLSNIDSLITTTHILDTNLYSSLSLINHYLYRILTATRYILTHKNMINQFQYVYSVSDFWPDFFPALLIKLLHPKINWIAGFYLFAPNPFNSQSPYNLNHYFLRGFLYYISQLPVYFLTKLLSNTVFVTSLPDVKRFPHQKVIVIKGGVDVGPSKKYFLSQKKNEGLKKYHAVYLGRLHFQKGVMELVDIWNYIIKSIPNAQLAVIGNGNLEKELKEKISTLGLNNNIRLFGFLDGPKKYEIFKQSQIVVHPATYDSGGMAAAEAMAWGLPGVSFDLVALKSYYPQGMLKSKCFDNQNFANNIIKLLKDKTLYNKISNEAYDLIHKQWSWDKRALSIFNQTFK